MPCAQEKKAPKKEPGVKPKLRPSEQSAQQQPDLLDDSQLPKSKVAMPVCLRSPDPFQSCPLLHESDIK